MLLLSPDFQLSFDEFRKVYGKVYGRQVPVYDCGFGGSLKDLFRSMRDTFEVSHKYIDWDGTELVGQVQLTESVRRIAKEDRGKILQNHQKLLLFEKELIQLRNALQGRRMNMTELCRYYNRFYQKQFKAEDYGFARMKHMLKFLPHIVKIEDTKPHATITLLPQKSTPQEDEQEELTCIVCMDLKPDTILVPCSHNNLCRPCAEKIVQRDKRCPIDRIHITGIIPLSSGNEEDKCEFKPRFSIK